MPVGLPSIRFATLNGVLLSKFDVDMVVVVVVRAPLSTYKDWAQTAESVRETHCFRTIASPLHPLSQTHNLRTASLSITPEGLDHVPGTGTLPRCM